MPRRAVLYVKDILVWADAFREARGRWPQNNDGAVKGGPGLTWCAIDQALLKGHRGLRGGQSLAIILLMYRKRRHRKLLPDFTTAQILGWADAHHKRTGSWPIDGSGPVRGAPGETWNAIHKALLNGGRGLPGGTTLPQFLEAHRGVRNNLAVPRLTTETILAWADDHHMRTERWPTRESGSVTASPNETWIAIDAAMVAGKRGLPGNDSVAKMLARERGVRYNRNVPDLAVEQIRAWAEAHKQRTGKWPAVKSGPVVDAPGETWAAIDQSLTVGRRGLPGGASLFRLLRGSELAKE